MVRLNPPNPPIFRLTLPAIKLSDFNVSGRVRDVWEGFVQPCPYAQARAPEMNIHRSIPTLPNGSGPMFKGLSLLKFQAGRVLILPLPTVGDLIKASLRSRLEGADGRTT